MTGEKEEQRTKNEEQRTMKTIEPTRELIPLKLIEPWARNPRGGELREMESFTEQLRTEGIREDVHVFRDAQGVLRLMQGHRRREAASRLGMEALWAKVWPFDENEAFLHLITMQQGADPFDARELAMASRTAMRGKRNRAKKDAPKRAGVPAVPLSGGG